jgi:hypothetical protein
VEIPEQVLTLDLPTLLIDSRLSRVEAVTQPGGRLMGYLAVEGQARAGLRLGSEESDPAGLSVNFRLLEASYSVPADCPPRVRELILRLNSELNARLLGGAVSPAA